MVVEINVDFDYNNRTFVPTRLPTLMDRNLFLQENFSQSIEGFEKQSAHHVIASMANWKKIDETKVQKVQIVDLHPLTELSKGAAIQGAAIRHMPWEELVERLFSDQCPLRSSIFDSSSWVTMQSKNIMNQFDLLKQSQHFDPFLLSVLRTRTVRPRHKTHVVLLQVQMGIGLGQFLQLTGYQVMTLEEAKHKA